MEFNLRINIVMSKDLSIEATNIVEAMEKDSGLPIRELRVDGGPTRNKYLMQMQSNLAGSKVLIPRAEELSGIGVAYAAGLATGLYDTSIFEKSERTCYENNMAANEREKYRTIWKQAVERILSKW